MKRLEKLFVRETLTIYLRHFLKYRFAAAALLVVILSATGVAMTLPLVVQRMIDDFARANPTDPQAFSFAIKHVALLLSVWVGAWTLWRIMGFITSTIQPRIRTELERTALEAIQRQSYRFFADEFTGSLVRRARSFATAYYDIAESVMGRFLPLIVEVTFLFIVFIRLHPYFLPILVTWFLLIGIKSFIFVRRKVVLDLERAAKDSKVTGVLSDVITNHLNVKLFTAHAFERERFFRVTEERQQIAIRTWRYGEWILVWQNVISAVFMLTVLGILAWLWSQNLVGLGIFAAAILYFNRLNRSMDDVGNAMRRVYEALAEAAEMTEIILQRPDVLDKRGSKELRVRKAEIVFRDVSFSYHDGRAVLDSFNLSVSPKEKIALVGPSGAGKSTVVKLLLRFHDLKNGSIGIDGQSVKDVTQDSLHQAIALVPQEPLLFHRSLRENIIYGRHQATDEEIVEAAKKAHCHEFISSLPNGYDTLVGERGVKLSGGERQRVAIARAILKNAPILVLDEATSSLDSESEALIQDALRELMKNKTVIVIAHRLSTIMQMDRIIVMEKGKVVDTGTHEELLKKVGIYQKLWNIQAGGFQTI
ncbi:ABC transporter ATP-binding protein [Candidatus Uhrbacteria bacterium]|nr:ABC transporter ATP-binding protein [Candidatus Uhrbacteria bacterium]